MKPTPTRSTANLALRLGLASQNSEGGNQKRHGQLHKSVDKHMYMVTHVVCSVLSLLFSNRLDRARVMAKIIMKRMLLLLCCISNFGRMFYHSREMSLCYLIMLMVFGSHGIIIIRKRRK